MKRIVLTGGPGGGKTTALDLFRRELHYGISIAPEAATILFENGFKRNKGAQELKKTQIAIYKLQKSLEEIFITNTATSTILCDRGSLDGLAYWPEEHSTFFSTVNSSLEKELKRYDAVIFFESGACAGGDLKSNNPYRNESIEQARELDHQLKSIWSQHPNFFFIKSDDSFIAKVIKGLEVIKAQISKSNYLSET